LVEVECPAASTRYNTASPLNGGLNDWEDDPAGIGAPARGIPVDGLNHSTDNVRDPDIAERSTVNETPDGA